MASSEKGVSDAVCFDLFAAIETHPCLWNADDPEYRNVNQRNEIWETLTYQLKEKYGGSFNADDLKKIFYVRKKQYQDEKKRKLVLERGQPPRYTGKWRFFSSLSFLDTRMGLPDVKVEQCTADASDILLSISSISADDSASRHSSLTIDPVVEEASTVKTPCRLSVNSGHALQTASNQLSTATGMLSDSEDECEVFGKLVACRMRRLPPSCYSEFQVKLWSKAKHSAGVTSPDQVLFSVFISCLFNCVLLLHPTTPQNLHLQSSVIQMLLGATPGKMVLSAKECVCMNITRGREVLRFGYKVNTQFCQLWIASSIWELSPEM